MDGRGRWAVARTRAIRCGRDGRVAVGFRGGGRREIPWPCSRFLGCADPGLAGVTGT